MKLINKTKQKVYVNGDILLLEQSYSDSLRPVTFSITSDVGNGIITMKEGKVSSIKSYKDLKITESKDDSGEKLITLSV